MKFCGEDGLDIANQSWGGKALGGSRLRTELSTYLRKAPLEKDRKDQGGTEKRVGRKLMETGGRLGRHLRLSFSRIGGGNLLSREKELENKGKVLPNPLGFSGIDTYQGQRKTLRSAV